MTNTLLTVWMSLTVSYPRLATPNKRSQDLSSNGNSVARRTRMENATSVATSVRLTLVRDRQFARRTNLFLDTCTWGCQVKSPEEGCYSFWGSGWDKDFNPYKVVTLNVTMTTNKDCDADEMNKYSLLFFSVFIFKASSRESLRKPKESLPSLPICTARSGSAGIFQPPRPILLPRDKNPPILKSLTCGSSSPSAVKIQELEPKKLTLFTVEVTVI